jgi:hypothetical protein
MVDRKEKKNADNKGKEDGKNIKKGKQRRVA